MERLLLHSTYAHVEVDGVNEVAWTPVARSSSQGRIRGISGSKFRENNSWPMRMPLRMSRISRPPLVGRKPVRKPKKKS